MQYELNLTLLLVPNVYNESETITKFEIMDGAPVRGMYNGVKWDAYT